MGRRKKRVQDHKLEAVHHKLEVPLEALVAEEKHHFAVYKTAGNIIADKILKILEAYSIYKISRKIVAGSIGKTASLGLWSRPDFDVVVFLNNKLPPFTDVVEEFNEILMLYADDNCPEWTKFHKSSVKTTSRTIQFSVDTKIEIGYSITTRIDFDLVPASNLVKNPEISWIEKCQTKAALKLIYEIPNRSSLYDYSSSLSERTVTFTKFFGGYPFDGFRHKVILLAKLWNGKISMEKKISGRSTMIELIALKAAVKTHLRISKAFTNFLVMMKNFSRIQVYFKSIGPEHYMYDTWCRQICICPLVLDPTNPFNNYADNVDEESKMRFEKRADETLTALKNGKFFEDIEEYFDI